MVKFLENPLARTDGGSNFQILTKPLTHLSKEEFFIPKRKRCYENPKISNSKSFPR
jgi:hypothetical protein